MKKTDLDKLNKARKDIIDCIANADITDLRVIDKALDALKDEVDEHILKLSGQGGDW